MQCYDGTDSCATVVPIRRYCQRNRKIGFGWAFGISLINVVIGLIVVLCSKKKTPNELEKKN
ncbi:hypothetical protein ACTNCZ_08585 [Segatella copri]|uniref:hypothetical protein n=1 Tax=Segatella copri TaxID=165179 RepID=UPI003F8B6C9A